MSFWYFCLLCIVDLEEGSLLLCSPWDPPLFGGYCSKYVILGCIHKCVYKMSEMNEKRTLHTWLR